MAAEHLQQKMDLRAMADSEVPFQPAHSHNPIWAFRLWNGWILKIVSKNSIGSDQIHIFSR